MKIFQVITRSSLGGAQSVVANLSNALCQDHEVTVVAGEGDGVLFGLLDGRVRKEHCPRLKRALSPKDDALSLWELRRLYRRYRPDVIHLHSSKAGILGRLAFPRKKIVYTVHGFDSVRLAYRRYLPVERLMQWRCAAVVGVSRYDELNLKAEGITRNVSYVYNGILPEEKNGMPLSWNVPKRFDRTVLCVARLSPQKDSALFLDVARQLPEYAFVWIGNQHPVPDVPKNVFFQGSLPHAERYNRLADIFMLPSNYEGLPMVILEAMSYGKPVVASDVGGIREAVEDGETGYVSENRADVFAAKIKNILEHPDIYSRFSSNALRLLRQKFTVEEMLDGYVKIYNRIMCG